MSRTALGDLDAFVLCGGEGTRLRPVVDDRPKPLADVAGRMFLDRLLEHLAAAGLRRFVLCTGYRRADVGTVRATLERWGEIVLSEEAQPLGTAGAIVNALAHRRSRDFFVFNGDSFVNVDLGAMRALHAERRATATIAVVPAARGEEGGAIRLGERGRVERFEEKARLGAGTFLNAGAYLMDERLLAGVEAGQPCSIERDVFPAHVGRGLHAFVHEGPLVDIGTPERYARAGRELSAAGLGAGCGNE